MEKNYNSSKLESIMQTNVIFLYLTFINLKIFNGFLIKVLNIVIFDQNKNMNMPYMKKCQSLNKMTKKNF